MKRLAGRAARKAKNAGGTFVAMTGDVVVGTADTLSDLLLIEAVSNIDYGKIVEVTGDVVGVVGDIAGGVVEAIGDADF